MRIPALAIIALTGVALGASADERELKGQTDAKQLSKLRLEAHIGTVEIEGTDGSEVRWSVRLEPKDEHGSFSWSADAQKAVDGATLRAAAAGATWELSVQLPRGSDSDSVKERWTVEVPRRFALDLDANIGEATVREIGGGVEAKLNIGDLRIDVPGGAIAAKVNIGEVRIDSQGKDTGAVRLEANIGDADLRMDGKHVGGDRQMLLGAEASYDGHGKDDISARVNVGDVRVRLESH